MVAKPQHTLPMILYADDCTVLPHKLDNTYYPGGDEDSTNGNVGYHTSHTNDVCCGLENLNLKWCRVLSLDGPDDSPDGQCEENLSGNRNTATSHTLQKPVGDQSAVRHVSFCDEVIVYLFDQVRTLIGFYIWLQCHCNTVWFKRFDSQFSPTCQKHVMSKHL